MVFHRALTVDAVVVVVAGGFEVVVAVAADVVAGHFVVRRTMGVVHLDPDWTASKDSQCDVPLTTVVRGVRWSDFLRNIE